MVKGEWAIVGKDDVKVTLESSADGMKIYLLRSHLKEWDFESIKYKIYDLITRAEEIRKEDAATNLAAQILN